MKPQNEGKKNWDELVEATAKDIGNRNNYPHQFDYGFVKGAKFAEANAQYLPKVDWLILICEAILGRYKNNEMPLPEDLHWKARALEEALEALRSKE